MPRFMMLRRPVQVAPDGVRESRPFVCKLFSAPYAFYGARGMSPAFFAASARLIAMLYASVGA